jgi:hypothetical protein
MSQSRIAHLASLIQEHTTKVDNYYTTHSLPHPSFSTTTPLRTVLPTDIQVSRNAVLEASDELTALMLGPIESLIPPVTS